jgi:hypothetical protein
MGIPQVTDRLKEAPAHALRAVFSGFGQLLLAAERLRGQPGDRAGDRPAGPAGDSAANPADGRPADPATGPAPAARPDQAPDPDPAAERWRSLDQTGNVRILSADDPAEDGPLTSPAASQVIPDQGTPAQAATDQAIPTQAAPDQGTPKAGAAGPGGLAAGTAEPAAAPPGAPEPGPAAAALPVPGYDALSLPSLRARLRNLDAGQLRVLIAYEHAHAGRADVVAMFERRIAKLAGE